MRPSCFSQKQKGKGEPGLPCVAALACRPGVTCGDPPWELNASPAQSQGLLLVYQRMWAHANEESTRCTIGLGKKLHRMFAGNGSRAN